MPLFLFKFSIGNIYTQKDQNAADKLENSKTFGKYHYTTQYGNNGRKPYKRGSLIGTEISDSSIRKEKCNY